MATIPLFPSLLMDVYKALKPDAKILKKETEFRTASDLSYDKQCETSHKMLTEILSELGFDENATLDLVGNIINEWLPFCKTLERNTWTYDASKKQILWYLWGYVYAPLLGRRVALWKLDAYTISDADMPGGKFWYLPHIDENTEELRLPIAFALDWWFDLAGSDAEIKNTLPQESQDVKGDKLDSILSNLNNWRCGSALPTVAKIEEYFSDNLDYQYANAIEISEDVSLDTQLKEVVTYIHKRDLTDEHLAMQIPMSPENIRIAINSVELEHISDELGNLQEKLVNSISLRYSAPSQEIVKQRLKVARIVQYGYVKLLKYLCPCSSKKSPCPKENKVLQLSSIYQVAYNSTIESVKSANKMLLKLPPDILNSSLHRERYRRGFEHVVMTQVVPEVVQKECLAAIMPENDDVAWDLLAEKFSTRFEGMKGHEELENLCIIDESWELEALERLKREKQLKDYYFEVRSLLRRKSPWRTIQSVDNAVVLCRLAACQTISEKALNAIIARVEEIDLSDSQRMVFPMMQLARLLNEPLEKKWAKDTKDIVQGLLEEVQNLAGYENWKAVFLQYEARHQVACNHLEAAEVMFKEALAACNDRNYGSIRGEIAWNGFSCLLANRNLNPKNHERYYRNIMEYTEFSSFSNHLAIPGIEEVAEAAREHFWNELYRPYPGIDRIRQIDL